MQKTCHRFLWALLLALSCSTCLFMNTRVDMSIISAYPFSTSTDFTNSTVIQPNIPYVGNFTNTTTTHNWKIENIGKSQLVYFSLSSHSSSSDIFKVELFDPSGTSYSTILHQTYGSPNFLASWTSPENSDWIIQVNDTRVEITENISYTIRVTVPLSAYSINTANLINSTPTPSNFSLSHETHYWKVILQENQNGRIFLKEITTLVLLGSQITIFREQYPDNPIHSREVSGSYNYSWNAPTTDTYFIVLAHDVLEKIGEYNISFQAETSRYNFETAEFIPDNQTVAVEVNQGFIPRKHHYFWFKVNISRTEVHIRVFESNTTTSTILNYAIIDLYDEGRQLARLSEREELQPQDGEFNITETLDTGKYYLVVSPESNAVGTFHISLEYQLPRPFIWDFPTIILFLGITVAFPVYLIYLDKEGKFYRGKQWTVSTTVQESYKIIRNSFRGLYSIKEVPNDSLLIRVASIPYRTFALLNFIEFSEEETLIFSKRINRKYEWGIYFLIALLTFDVLNIISFFLFSFHLLPLYFANLTSLILFLAVPTIIMLIIVLFTNVSAYITYSQVLNRISYIIQYYQESGEDTRSPLSMDPIQAEKSINYVRVLWNQARHAFKDHNFELFVIKADAAVKNLLSTRYLQVCLVNSQSKPDFQTQVVELRKRGFDLPNDKKIAHFRNLRNRIVHSSVTLGEKESVDCFAYYSAFITRLGLRPT